MEIVLRIIFMMIGFISLLFLAYVTARYIGGRQMKAMRGNYISVLETVIIGADKRLHLVKAGNTYVLVATTSKSVEFLTTVDIGGEASEEMVEAAKEKPLDFRALFEKYTGMTWSKKNTGLRTEPTGDSGEATGRYKLKTNLNRLRALMSRNMGHIGKNGDESTNDEEQKKG